jgi:RNA-binding protein 23/39
LLLPVGGSQVLPSQSEKNAGSSSALIDIRITDTITRLYVGGQNNVVAELTSQDLKALFEPFGPIDFVDIHPR